MTQFLESDVNKTKNEDPGVDADCYNSDVNWNRGINKESNNC